MNHILFKNTEKNLINWLTWAKNNLNNNSELRIFQPGTFERTKLQAIIQLVAKKIYLVISDVPANDK